MSGSVVCGITGIPFTDGRAVMILAKECKSKSSEQMINSRYEVHTLPIRGTYSGYNSLENIDDCSTTRLISHTTGLDFETYFKVFTSGRSLYSQFNPYLETLGITIPKHINIKNLESIGFKRVKNPRYDTNHFMMSLPNGDLLELTFEKAEFKYNVRLFVNEEEFLTDIERYVRDKVSADNYRNLFSFQGLIEYLETHFKLHPYITEEQYEFFNSHKGLVPLFYMESAYDAFTSKSSDDDCRPLGDLTFAKEWLEDAYKEDRKETNNLDIDKVIASASKLMGDQATLKLAKIFKDNNVITKNLKNLFFFSSVGFTRMYLREYVENKDNELANELVNLLALSSNFMLAGKGFDLPFYSPQSGYDEIQKVVVQTMVERLGGEVKWNVK